MSITQDTTSTGSLDVIGRLSDHNREDREERAAGTRGWRRFVRLVGPPFIVFLIFIGIWYLFRAFFLNDSQRFLVPAPHDIVSVAFFKWSNLHPLLDALWLSARV